MCFSRTESCISTLRHGTRLPPSYHYSRSYRSVHAFERYFGPRIDLGGYTFRYIVPPDRICHFNRWVRPESTQALWSLHSSLHRRTLLVMCLYWKSDRTSLARTFFFFADDIAGRISPLASLPVNDTPFPKGSHYFQSHLRAHAHCGFGPVRRDRLLCGLRKNCACTLYLFFLLLISACLNSRLICSYTHML